MIIHGTQYAQDKKFELSLGAQRMMNFNMGSLVGNLGEHLMITKEKKTTTLAYDISLSRIFNDRSSVTLGISRLTMGREISGDFIAECLTDLSNNSLISFPEQLHYHNLHTTYNHTLLKLNKFNIDGSDGIAYWFNRGGNVYFLSYKQRLIAGILKLGMSYNINNLMIARLNVLNMSAFSNALESTYNTKSYFPSVIGFEARLGCRF